MSQLSYNSSAKSKTACQEWFLVGWDKVLVRAPWCEQIRMIDENI